MRINNESCNCLSPQIECENFGPFVAKNINCINFNESGEANDSGSIIPFSSGISTSVVTIGPDFGLTSSLIGFGTAINGVPILNNTINLSGLLSEAFSVPRNGNITAISAAFNYFLDLNRGGLTTITAQIYRAPVGSNIFTATNIRVDLAPPVAGVPAGITFGSANVEPVPVSVGDRLLMVFYISSIINPPALNFSVEGTASAGINIV